MENASKALLMAAGTLIGILILSLAVYLFVSFGSTSREVNKQVAEQQIEQFNSQFTSYEGKVGITIHDVITIANLATENNIYYELTRSEANQNNNYIKVTLKGDQIEGYYGKKYDYNEYIKNETMKNDKEGVLSLPKYECEVRISPVTKRVYEVSFIEKPE